MTVDGNGKASTKLLLSGLTESKVLGGAPT